MKADRVECEACGHAGSALLWCIGNASVLECRWCGLRFVWPQPDSASTAAFYGDEYWRSRKASSSQGGVEEGFEVAQRARFVAARERLAFVESRGASESVLDVGCGFGAFLVLAREHGMLGVGVEPSGDASRYCREELDLDVRTGMAEELPVESERFDAVCLWHVLEHVRSPRKVLAEVARVLRPSGLVFIETPNVAGRQARAQGAAWRYVDPAEHLFYFTPPSLVALLERAGFRPAPVTFASAGSGISDCVASAGGRGLARRLRTLATSSGPVALFGRTVAIRLSPRRDEFLRITAAPARAQP